MYDYLIVGAGLFGAVFAHEMTQRGKRCLVIDKRAHTGGNCHTENVAGINVHCYGAHIFHTSDRRIWDYINQFADFNNFINSPVLGVVHIVRKYISKLSKSISIEIKKTYQSSENILRDMV